ncbi:SCO family protein [Thalassospiraceae bacterium LMO-JJ14]|nr:SCO family protein [Thalassospiraceae bacterium LMO-JJ14]
MPRFRSLLTGLAVAFGSALISLTHADAGVSFDRAKALEASQASLGNIIGSYRFTDTRNQPVTLEEYMDKPLVISLVYTGCADICPMVSEALADAVSVARDALGADSFQIVTIGFDARNDSPNRMRSYAASHGINVKGWHFLSADAASIDALSRDLGFSFNPSPQGFDHLSQTTVIDTDGKVYRHIYGADFKPPLLVEPLKQLTYGGRIEMTSIEGLINRVRLFCTLYDPASGKYKFDYSIFIATALGALSLGGVAVVLVRSWLAHRRSTRHA